jgi:hypothetical protein
VNRAPRILLSVLGVSAAAWASAWIWISPSLVNKRAHQRIAIGARWSEVAKEFQVKDPFEVRSAAHCGSDGPADITRITLYDAGSLPVVPMLVYLKTTTTFCFDYNNILVGIKTDRWIDAP